MVVDGFCDLFVVFRFGGVGIDELRSCLGWENVMKVYKDVSEEGKVVLRVLGMKYKYYSFKVRVVFYEIIYEDGNVGVMFEDY